MKKENKFAALLLTLTFAGACTYEAPEGIKQTSGNADFTKVVTVGSSMGAGFMNGALYDSSQKYSSFSILANQMKSVGGGEFNQPDIKSVNGYYGVAPGPTILGRLYFKVNTGTNCLGTANNPDITPKIPGESPGAYTGDKDLLNNFSVYGVTIQTAQLPALGGPSSANPFYNPYYARFASVPGTSTLIDDTEAALENGGTFFVFWLGIDDAYAFALNGADENDPTKPLTSNGAFDGAYAAAVTSLLNAETEIETKGVLANIPSISSLPYFSTVRWNQIVFLDCNPTDVATVAQLNSGSVYGGYNGALDYLASEAGGNKITQADADSRKVVFHTGTTAAAGANAIVIKDQTLTDIGADLAGVNPALAGFGQVREAAATDLITLSAGAVLPTGVGVSPAAGFLGDKYVLLPSEQATIQASIDHFNATISATVAANSDRLALVDINTLLNTLKTTVVTIKGSTLTASFIPPFGAYTLDGIHLNARGNAYIANEFIRVINSKFKSTIPSTNPNNFPGTELPIP